MSSTLLHLLGPILAIGAILYACKRRAWPLVETLALRWPSPRQGALWVGAFATWFVVSEYVYTTLGFSEGQAWGDRYSLSLIILRVVGMVILAPVAEESVFRGLMFARISGTRVGPVGAVLITAAIFAAIHIQYEPALIAFILADGLFFGLVRWRTNSLYLPIVFHSLGNLYVVFERLTDSGLFY